MTVTIENEVRVADSRTASTTYLEPDPTFLVENYDPYMMPITEDVVPEEVLESPPSWWERLLHALAATQH